MFRSSLLVTAAFYIGLAAGPGSNVRAEADSLTAKMAKLAYLLGTWTCGKGSVETFKVAPGNTIHEHGSNGTESDDSYFTFNPVLMAYEMTGANNGGFHWFFRSMDGVTFWGKHFAGVARSYKVTLIYRHDSEKTMNVHQDTTTDGGIAGSDVECMRQ